MQYAFHIPNVLKASNLFNSCSEAVKHGGGGR